jgi:hypothetical protein
MYHLSVSTGSYQKLLYKKLNFGKKKELTAPLHSFWGLIKIIFPES